MLIMTGAHSELIFPSLYLLYLLCFILEVPPPKKTKQKDINGPTAEIRGGGALTNHNFLKFKKGLISFNKIVSRKLLNKTYFYVRK